MKKKKYLQEQERMGFKGTLSVLTERRERI